MISRLEGWSCALLAGLALLPGLAGATTLLAYFADWPERDNGPRQFLAGLVAGVGAWVLISLLACRGLSSPESANAAVYAELCVRVTSLDARIATVRQTRQTAASSEMDIGALELATRHRDALKAELNLADKSDPAVVASRGSCRRWLLASGYVNAWRRVHRAEEALLEFEREDDLYLAASMDLARLEASSIEGSDLLVKRLAEFRTTIASRQKAASENAGKTGPTGKANGATARREEHICWKLWRFLFCRARRPAKKGKVPERTAVLTTAELTQLRALLRESRYALNKYRNGLWDELVRLRNLLFTTMVSTGIVAYTVLGLSVVTEASREAITAAVAFYLVGAAVGLFGELYATSRRESGVVNDYGLADVRILTIPLLSGIAGVGGVVLTRLTATTSEGVPDLSEIFSLSDYPFGLVIAAIFGLTPGLLLERLRTQTDKYKKDIAKSGVGAQQQSGGATAPPTATA